MRELSKKGVQVKLRYKESCWLKFRIFGVNKEFSVNEENSDALDENLYNKIKALLIFMHNPRIFGTNSSYS